MLTELKAKEAAAEQKVRQLRMDVTAAPGSLTAELTAAQQAVDAARSAHAAARQSQEQHAAQTSALEAELAAALAAAAAQQERQQEAAWQVEQLRKQLQESAQLAVEAQARLQAAQQGHVSMLAAAQEAQAALAAAEAELEDLERQLAGPQRAEHGHRDTAGSAAPSRQTPDQAVAALAASCSPGTFHGRLHSVLRLTPQGPSQGQGRGSGSVAIAVNAALLELCNPVRASGLACSGRGQRGRTPAATCSDLLLPDVHKAQVPAHHRMRPNPPEVPPQRWQARDPCRHHLCLPAFQLRSTYVFLLTGVFPRPRTACRAACWWWPTAPPHSWRYLTLSITAWASPPARSCASCQLAPQAQAGQPPALPCQQQQGHFPRVQMFCHRSPPVWWRTLVVPGLPPWQATCSTTGGWQPTATPLWRRCRQTGGGAGGGAAL